MKLVRDIKPEEINILDTLQKQFQAADRRLQGVLSKSTIVSIINRFNVPVSQDLLNDILG